MKESDYKHMQELGNQWTHTHTFRGIVTSDVVFQHNL